MAVQPIPDNINLCALKQRDPYIKRIVDKAKMVVLYTFDQESDKWVSSLCIFLKTGLKFFSFQAGISLSLSCASQVLSLCVTYLLAVLF